MLAVAWLWPRLASDDREDLSVRLANSLCAGIGGYAGHSQVNGTHFAYRALRWSAASARAWKPAILPSGDLVAFHGSFDNASEIAASLAVDPEDQALLYGLAVARWGDQADRNIIGEYCAVIASIAERRLRLSRSPLRAPPLCYFHDGPLSAAASVPRALFAAGVERRLNEARLADSALLNFTDTEAGWFEGVSRVPLGSIVELEQGKPRVLRTYYDPLAVPDVRLSDADTIARASELLDQGVKSCLAGFRSPGVTLSGGLDSPQVAIRALANLPATRRLPTFTFHPEEGFDGLVEPWLFADDRPFVEAFAATHPRLDPHFTANEGYAHDYRFNEFFHLLGGAPASLCNMYVFHGVFRAAADRGCDVLLVSDWGNETFSSGGDWGFVEYLFTGQWREYWRALSGLPSAHGSMVRRFVAQSIMPLLPPRLWRFVRRLAFPGKGPLIEQITPLNRAFRHSSGAGRRLKQSGVFCDRANPWTRKQAPKQQFERGDFEMDEMYQGFEQMYGVAQRDPTAYRPFVEFCLGLPTKMFMRDGQLRWLARQMGRGIMPERQRLNPLEGRWDSDWHVRMGRRRADYIAELDRLAANARVASIIDIPRLRAALEDWPDHTLTDRHAAVSREIAVPRGLLTARFINYVEGRNET